MDTFIVGLSGKKQSGKNTICDKLYSFVEGSHIPYIYPEKWCKIYSFADALKEKVCMGVLGLTLEQCYGSDEYKNSLTQYQWTFFPEEIRKNNKGFMTAREVMQTTGTNIFRNYFDDKIWVNATFRKIEEEGYKIALISDVRFPSEVEGIIENKGIVVKLLRSPCETDNHSSETTLDDYDWESLNNNSKKCYIIDNREMTIEEQNAEARSIFSSLLCEKNIL
jgi:hypothetical protein